MDHFGQSALFEKRQELARTLFVAALRATDLDLERPLDHADGDILHAIDLHVVLMQCQVRFVLMWQFACEPLKLRVDLLPKEAHPAPY